MFENLCLVHYKPVGREYLSYLCANSARQFFSDQYHHPFFHHHTPNGKSIARGAKIQFKLINQELYLLGVGEEGVAFMQSFQWPQEIKIRFGNTMHTVLMTYESLKTDLAKFSLTPSLIYRTISPYLPLNQQAYSRFRKISDAERRLFIENRLKLHILSAAKWCGVWVKHQITTSLIAMRLCHPIKVKKSLTFAGMNVMFETNTEIPNFMGIGRFVSRGYGTVVKYG